MDAWQFYNIPCECIFIQTCTPAVSVNLDKMASKLAILFVAFAFFGCVLAQSNNFETGYKEVGDRQLHYEIVQKSSSILQVVTRDITFPAAGQLNNATISYIRALDQYINGDGGYCSLLNGGVNLKQVTLHFKSQRGHGFNFILEIWGR